MLMPASTVLPVPWTAFSMLQKIVAALRNILVYDVQAKLRKEQEGERERVKRVVTDLRKKHDRYKDSRSQ